MDLARTNTLAVDQVMVLAQRNGEAKTKAGRLDSDYKHQE